MRRTHKALTDVERALYLHSPDAAHWPHALALNLSRQQRYHALAEASFQKNLRLVEFMKAQTDKREAIAAKARAEREKANPNVFAEHKKLDAELAAAAVLKSGGKADPKKDAKTPPAPQSRAQQLFSGQNNTRKRKKIVRLEQWVEVRTVDGKTETQLYPSNAKLIERGKSMLPPPDFVYRRLNFPDGIPPEYDWVGVIDENHRQRGGMGIQRMTIDTWLELVDSEAQRGDGHLSPTGNLPRPEEHGGCDCTICTRNREILEATAEPDPAA
jgi:hypothetical protein